MFQHTNLFVLAYANGFTLWHYAHSGTIDKVESECFFKKAHSMMMKGDLVIVNAQDASCTYWVTSTDNLDIVVKANMQQSIL